MHRKDQALFAFLVLSPDQPHSRDKLATLLWGSYGHEAARHSLRQSLANLRQSGIAQTAVKADRHVVSLDSSAVDVDVTNFSTLAASRGKPDLEAAVALLKGEFLEGLYIGEEAFEDWLANERQRIRAGAAKTLLQLGEIYRREGNGQKACESARALLGFDPYNEESLRRLMELLAGAGSDLEALKHYHQLADVLMRDLGLKPDPKTTAIYLKIAGARLGQAETLNGSDKRDLNLLDAFRSLDGFVMWDEDDRFVLANEQFRDIFAPAREVLVPGTRWEETMKICIEKGRFPDALRDPQRFLSDRLKRRREGRSEALDLRLDDGRWFRMSHRPVPGKGIVVVFTDATSRKNRELALLQTQRRYRAVLTAMPYGVEEVDLQGKIVFCSDALCGLLGYSRTEVIGRNQSAVMRRPWNAALTAQLAAKRRRRALQMPRQGIPTTYLAKSGQHIAATVHWSVVHDDEGRMTGYVGVIVPRTGPVSDVSSASAHG